MENREKYITAVKSELADNIFKHSLALEACMSALYDYFQANNLLTASDEPKEEWMTAGLIHDIDFSEEYKATHPQKTLEVLAKYSLIIPASVHDIVKAHAPELTGKQPSNKAQWSIFCADSLTGLITAVALI